MQVDYITAVKIVCPQQLISHQLFKLEQTLSYFDRFMRDACL